METTGRLNDSGLRMLAKVGDKSHGCGGVDDGHVIHVLSIVATVSVECGADYLCRAASTEGREELGSHDSLPHTNYSVDWTGMFLSAARSDLGRGNHD